LKIGGWSLITRPITHQPTNSTIPQPPRTKNDAPAYQITTPSGNVRLSYWWFSNIPAHIKGPPSTDRSRGVRGPNYTKNTLEIIEEYTRNLETPIVDT